MTADLLLPISANTCPIWKAATNITRICQHGCTSTPLQNSPKIAKDENNNLKMKACNGILMLKFGNITDADGVEGVKRSVAMLPSTFAALEGADGKSVIVLVKFRNEDDSLPADEADAERLYRIAYQQILPVYQAIAKASVLTDGPNPSIEAGANLSFEPSMHNSFMMTLDAKPYFNSKAVAMKIDSNMRPQNQAFNTEDNQQMIPGSDTSEEEKKVDKNSVRILRKKKRKLTRIAFARIS